MAKVFALSKSKSAAEARNETSPSVLLVHGGPGMDSSYFRRPFTDLNLSADIYAYDQSGSESYVPTVDSLIQELVTAVKDLRRKTGNEIVLFAHSWGSYLALRALSVNRGLNVAGLVLSNPLPLTWDQLTAATHTLTARLDAETSARIELLEQRGSNEAGKEVMKLAIRAYLSPQSGEQTFTFDTYIPKVSSGVMEQLHGYRLELGELALPQPSLVIYGADDYIPVGVLGNPAGAMNSVTIQRAGHFPFAENPSEFRRALQRYIDELRVNR